MVGYRRNVDRQRRARQRMHPIERSAREMEWESWPASRRNPCEEEYLHEGQERVHRKVHECFLRAGGSRSKRINRGWKDRIFLGWNSRDFWAWGVLAMDGD